MVQKCPRRNVSETTLRDGLIVNGECLMFNDGYMSGHVYGSTEPNRREKLYFCRTYSELIQTLFEQSNELAELLTSIVKTSQSKTYE